MKFSTCAIALLVTLISGAVFAADSFPGLKDSTIIIIRHAEKPDDGSGLAPAGEARAAAYVNYFKGLAFDGEPVSIDYLIAAADSKNSHRPRLTIEPISKALGLPIESRFKDKDYKGLADELAAKPHGKMILIAWHHGEIPELVQALGAKHDELFSKGKWPENVFGWMIVMSYDSDGKLIKAKRFEEKLMPDDQDSGKSKK